MADFLKAYGARAALVAWMLVAVWLLGLVVIPQANMFEKSLWSMEAGTAEVSAAIDRGYNELSVLKFDFERASDPEKRVALDSKIQALSEQILRLEEREKRPTKVYGTQNYTRLSRLHLDIFLKTIGYSLLVTVLSLVACYPVAYAAALASTPRRATLLLIALVVPFSLNQLLRIYAWLMILDYHGVLNTMLDWFGLIDLAKGGGIPFLETNAGVFLAMIYAFVLFMIFPIYNSLETLDRAQIEAARDLGASIPRIHRRIVIPHAKPGIAEGCVMTFMLSAGSYSVPQIMSRGAGGDWFSQLIYRQIFEANNWNVGAAYAFSLLVICLAFILAMLALFRVRLNDIVK